MSAIGGASSALPGAPSSPPLAPPPSGSQPAAGGSVPGNSGGDSGGGSDGSSTSDLLQAIEQAIVDALEGKQTKKSSQDKSSDGTDSSSKTQDANSAKKKAEKDSSNRNVTDDLDVILRAAISSIGQGSPASSLQNGASTSDTGQVQVPESSAILQLRRLQTTCRPVWRRRPIPVRTSPSDSPAAQAVSLLNNLLGQTSGNSALQSLLSSSPNSNSAASDLLQWLKSLPKGSAVNLTG